MELLQLYQTLLVSFLFTNKSSTERKIFNEKIVLRSLELIGFRLLLIKTPTNDVALLLDIHLPFATLFVVERWVRRYNHQIELNSFVNGFRSYHDSCLTNSVGIHDITGPSAEIGFMGYGNPSQNGAGIHYRLHARAFVFVDDGASNSRFAYVNIETAMIFHEAKVAAIKLLNQRFGPLYNFNNTMISATHTVRTKQNRRIFHV